MAKKITPMNTAAIMSIFFIAMGIGTIHPHWRQSLRLSQICQFLQFIWSRLCRH